MKVKEYVDFAHFETDPHRQDVDLICIVGKPNGYVCADFITDCRRWQTAFRRFFNVLGSDPRFEGWDSTVYEAMLSDLITDLIRAKTPKEKEAAYRRLEKLGVDRFTADVAAEELRKEVRL